MAKPLPQDVIDDILLRLPIKSIRRFMCVSKQWKSDLSNPRFGKAYLKKNIDTADPENLLCAVDRSLFVLTLNPGERVSRSSSNSEGSSEDGLLRRIAWPFQHGVVDCEVGGSCNGLILLVGTKYDDADSKFVINPITLECERVLDDAAYDRFVVYGMGYNESEDDYQIVSHIGENEDCVDIYSLKSKTWKQVSISYSGSLQGHNLKYYRYVHIDRYAGVFVEGCIHWVALDYTDGGRCVISSFNLASKKFEEIPPPSVVKSVFEKGGSEIKVVRGCLAVVFSQGRSNVTMDVWVMRQYGAQDSWTKLTFHLPEWYSLHKLVFLMSDYELVLKEYRQGFVSYDSRNGVRQNLVVGGVAVPLRLGGSFAPETASFRGSLVSPNYG